MNTYCEVNADHHSNDNIEVYHGTAHPWRLCGYHAFANDTWRDAPESCTAEFGLHEHDEAECNETLDRMANPFGSYDPWEDMVSAYARDAEEARLGRPLFPNEY